MKIGYAYLLDTLKTGAFELPVVAEARPVQRIMKPQERRPGSVLVVPGHVAPRADAPALEHLLFAMKHEGLEMQQTILALKKIDRSELDDAITESPNSEYVRRAAYLWELANPSKPALESKVLPTAPYQNLFDPEDHFTARPRRGAEEAKWRIDFNGLGTRQYCPTVRRTPALNTLITSDIIGRAKTFSSSLNSIQLNRILRWAYLSETRGSDQLEREATSHDKELRFSQLLSTSANAKPFSEESLAEIQSAALTNPINRAFAYRNQQNWLVNGVKGPMGVTYVPPAPGLCSEIMEEIAKIANDLGSKVDPLIAAALVSFGTVLAHPFMDGNGRVHRFIFHAQVCSRAEMNNGLILPISVAIGRHEPEYLGALESFSKSARQLWDITRIDDQVQACNFLGDESIYRYWDATECVTFGVKMADAALEQDLLEEHQYLSRHDAAIKAVGKSIDMQNSDLSFLVREVLTKGNLSNNRMKQFLAKGYTRELLDAAQDIVLEADLEDQQDSSPNEFKN
jgi:Fic family protein